MNREAMDVRVFELTVGPYGRREIEVVRFQGQEEISRPYSFEVTLEVAGADPGRFSADVLGAAARLTLHTAGGPARRIHGIVHRVRADALDVEKGLAWYTIRLVPKLRLLGHKKNSRIFQDQTVPEIVGDILRESSVDHAWRLAHAYGKRAYCVQYQETDLHFVTRLLAEEGIFYFIEDPPAGAEETASEIVVCADIAEHYPAVGFEPRVPFREPSGMAKIAEHVHAFGLRDRVRPGSALVKYFDFRRPSADLTSSAEAPRADPSRYSEAPLCIDDYQFELEEDAADPQAAGLWLEQQRATKTVGLGQSRCRRLAPGRRFVLEDHPDHTLNQPYAVLRVEHEGATSADSRMPWRGRRPEAPGAPLSEGAPGEAFYRNRFSCLPADVAARPRRPRRRLQQVMETATVVGPAGEEIHTDEYGRIKVQFHWDRKGRRNERSSCWIRTMQPWAGASWGFQFIPRVGMEVVVMFAGGDTDRPMVSGCAYNGVLPPPYPLPMNKTRSGIRTSSSPGGQGSNELMFEDAASREQIYLHAQRDFEEMVEHDHRRTVRGEEIVNVAGSRETTIEGDHVRTVLGNEVVTIEKNLVLHITGKQIIHVDGRSDTDAAGEMGEPLQAEQPPGAHVSPSITAEVKPPGAGASPQEILEAKLIFYVAQLPPDLQRRGEELLGKTEAAIAQISALRQDVQDLVIAADQGPGPELTARAMTLADRAAQATLAVRDVLAQAEAMPDGRLAKARDAACQQLQIAMVESGLLEQEIRRARASAAPPGALPDTGEAGEPGPRTSGSGRGGGGATMGFKDETLSFWGAPDDKGMRIAKKVPGGGGSRMVIRGGGEIDSEEGFRIKAAGCSLEMSDGIISLTGAQVIITAGQVTVIGGTVDVQGGEVKVKGDPIRLN
jgi:type VI secretion system secreted protein VgrG